MDLKEAIIHTRQVAEGCGVDSRDCAYQHDKLGDWLEELQDYHSIGTRDEFCAALRRTAENDKARVEGRLVELPCKLGGTLYRVRRFTRGENWRKEAAFVQPIKLTMSNVAKIVLGGELGKTVFLTPEAARAALGGGEGD